MAGQGFVLTPNGIKQLEPSSGGAVVSAAGFVAALSQAPRPADATPAPSSTPVKPATTQRFERRHYAKELRARLKEVDRALSALRQLENERAEIKRLLAALKAPPATVTPLHARRSG